MSHKMSHPLVALEALLSSRDSGWLGDDVNSQAEGTDGGWHWAVAVTDEAQNCSNASTHFYTFLHISTHFYTFLHYTMIQQLIN